MKFSYWNRKIHFYISVIIFLPFLVTSATGVLLILRHHSETIQPSKVKRDHKEVNLSYSEIENIVFAAGIEGVSARKDISKVVISPNKGLIEVFSAEDMHIQLDANSGAILKTAPRYSGFLITLHEGVFFHELVRDGIFLPMSILVFILLLTGIYLIYEQLFPRRRKKSRG